MRFTWFGLVYTPYLLLAECYDHTIARIGDDYAEFYTRR